MMSLKNKTYVFKGQLNFKKQLKNIQNPQIGDLYYIKYDIDDNYNLIDLKSCFLYDGKDFVLLNEYVEDNNDEYGFSKHELDFISFIEKVMNVKLYYHQKVLITKWLSMYYESRCEDNG